MAGHPVDYGVDPRDEHVAYVNRWYGQAVHGRVAPMDKLDPEQKALVRSYDQVGETVCDLQPFVGEPPTVHADMGVAADVDKRQTYVLRQELIKDLPLQVTSDVVTVLARAKGVDVAVQSKLMGLKLCQSESLAGRASRNKGSLLSVDTMQFQGFVLSACLIRDALRHNCVSSGIHAAGRIHVAVILAPEAGPDRRESMGAFSNSPRLELGMGLSDAAARVAIHAMGPALDFAHVDNAAWTRPGCNHEVPGSVEHVVIIKPVGDNVPVFETDARLMTAEDCDALLAFCRERVGCDVVTAALTDAAMLNLAYRPSVGPEEYTGAQVAGELFDTVVAPVPPDMPLMHGAFPAYVPLNDRQVVNCPARSGPPVPEKWRMQRLAEVLTVMLGAGQAAQAAEDGIELRPKSYGKVRYADDGFLHISADPTRAAEQLYGQAEGGHGMALPGCFMDNIIQPSAVPPDFLPDHFDDLWREYAFCAQHVHNQFDDQAGIDGVYFAVGPQGGMARIPMIVDGGREVPRRIPRHSTVGDPQRDGVRDVFGRVLGGRMKVAAIDADAAAFMLSGLVQVESPARHHLGNQRNMDMLVEHGARDRHLAYALCAMIRGAVIGDPNSVEDLRHAACDFPGLNTVVPWDVGIAEFPFGSFEVMEHTFRRGHTNVQAYLGLRKTDGLKYEAVESASVKVLTLNDHIAADEFARETGRMANGPVLIALDVRPAYPVHRIHLAAPVPAHGGATTPGLVATGCIPARAPDRFGYFNKRPRIVTPGVPGGSTFARSDPTGNWTRSAAEPV